MTDAIEDMTVASSKKEIEENTFITPMVEQKIYWAFLNAAVRRMYNFLKRI